MCTSRSFVICIEPTSCVSWFLKFSRPAADARKLCSIAIARPWRIAYPACDDLLCVSTRAADSYGTRDARPSSKLYTFHLIFASGFSRYTYGRMLRVNGLFVASVISPSMRSVRKELYPFSESGRCQRWCRLFLCESSLMSRPAGPNRDSYCCIKLSVEVGPEYVFPATLPVASCR